MPRKRRVKRKQQGEGPIWDAIKRGARSIHDFVKSNRLISRGAASLAPIAGPYSGAISKAGNVAATLGYGRKRKRKTKRKK